MPNLSIENLGSLGLITDKAPFELNPEAFSSAQNVMFSSEGVASAEGHFEVFDGLLHAPYWMYPWFGPDGFSWIYPSLNRIAHVGALGDLEITRFTTVLGDDDYNSIATTLWSGATLASLPVLTNDNAQDVPQAWDSNNNRLFDLPNWPAGSYADLVIAFRNYLITFRVTKTGLAKNKFLVKWSQVADPGTYPNSWDETDPATGAGEQSVTDTPGEIVAVKQMRDAVLIYKADSVVSMRWVGGQSVFSFKTIIADFGAVSQEAVGAIENSHVVVTQGDVKLHNGATSRSIIDDRNRRLLFDSMDTSLLDRLQVVVRESKTEVWICYADSSNNGLNNRALIWNYVDDTWSVRRLQDFNFLTIGSFTSNTALSFDAGAPLTFDQDLEIFDKRTGTGIHDDLLMCESAATKMFALGDVSTLDGVAQVCLLERTGLGIVGRDRAGNWRTDLDSRKFVRRLQPKLKASGVVQFYVGGQEFVDGSVFWQGPFDFDPRVDKHIDFRINTRFFALRLESSTAINWTFYGYVLDLSVIGEVQR